MKTQLYKNPAWNLEYQGDLLVFHGGADEMLAIEDVPPAAAKGIVAEWQSAARNFQLTQLSGAAQNTCQQLITAGVLQLKSTRQKRLKLAITWYGSVQAQLQQAITEALSDVTFTKNASDADWLICIRTNAKLRELLEVNHNTPQLFIDCAYAHTISLGPVVYPEYTSTIADLAGRLIYAWGDPAPPKQPAVQHSVHVIAELAALELRSAIADTSKLINRTVSYNFKAHTVSEDAVYKNPQAPHNKRKQESFGYVELW